MEASNNNNNINDNNTNNNNNKASSSNQGQKIPNHVAHLDPKRLQRMQKLHRNREYSRTYRSKESQYEEELRNAVIDLEARVGILCTQCSLYETHKRELQHENAKLRHIIAMKEAEAAIQEAETERLKNEKNVLAYLEMQKNFSYVVDVP